MRSSRRIRKAFRSAAQEDVMKALSIGGAMIDTIAIIESERIERMSMLNAEASFLLLEEGRKTEAIEVSTHCGGGAINTAVAMSRLGLERRDARQARPRRARRPDPRPAHRRRHLRPLGHPRRQRADRRFGADFLARPQRGRVHFSRCQHAARAARPH